MGKVVYTPPIQAPPWMAMTARFDVASAGPWTSK